MYHMEHRDYKRVSQLSLLKQFRRNAIMHLFWHDVRHVVFFLRIKVLVQQALNNYYFAKNAFDGVEVLGSHLNNCVGMLVVLEVGDCLVF